MKKIICVLLTFVLSITLIACSSSNNENSNSTTTPSNTDSSNTENSNSDNDAGNTSSTSENTSSTTGNTSSDSSSSGSISSEVSAAEFIPFIEGSATISKYTADSYKEYVRVSVPYLHTDEAFRTQYSTIDSIIYNLTTTSANGAASISNQLTTLATEDYEALEDESTFSCYYNDMITSVIRSDSIITSILLCDSSYTGGEYSNKSFNTYNINTQTGGFLALTDVFNDGSSLRKALTSKIKENYPGVKFFLLEDNIAYAITDGTLNFTIGYDNVTFYFPANTVASYEVGEIVVSLDYSTYSDIMNSAIFNVPKEYTIHPQFNQNYCFDVDNDGKVDKLLMKTSSDNEYGEIDKITFYINGEQVLEKSIISSYYAQPYYMRTASGKSYLYIQTTYLSDDNTIYGFGFEDGKIVDLGEVGELFATNKDTINDYSYLNCYAFTPSNITLYTRTDLVSTTAVYKSYHVGDDGKFVANDSTYSFNYQPSITAKTEIGVQLIDEAGNVTGEGTITAGETITAFRLLDDLKTCDFKKEDGTFVRIVFDNNDFGMLNDVPVYELFDNVLLAD